MDFDFEQNIKALSWQKGFETESFPPEMNAPRNLRGYVPGLPSFVCFRFMEDWFRRRQGLFYQVFDPEYNINDILPQPKKK